MRKVYRIEDNNGDGPYKRTNTGTARECYYAHNEDDDDSHPGPCFTTGPNYMQFHEFSGCSTLEGLREWFGEFYEGLLEEGYSMVVYDVDEEYVRDCCNSDQLVFRKGMADRGED
jgi:hypothetical protein